MPFVRGLGARNRVVMVLGLVGASIGLAACKTLASTGAFPQPALGKVADLQRLRVLSKKDSRITIETKSDAEK